MLHIWCVKSEELWSRKDVIQSPDARFNSVYKDEWLESDLGRRIITEIEQIPLIYPSVKMSIHAVCSVREISGGGKNLFLCKYLDYFNKLTRMGENCHSILMDIADTKEVNMITDTYISISEEAIQGRPIVIEDLGRVVRNSRESESAMLAISVGDFWDPPYREEFDDLD